MVVAVALHCGPVVDSDMLNEQPEKNVFIEDTGSSGKRRI